MGKEIGFQCVLVERNLDWKATASRLEATLRWHRWVISVQAAMLIALFVAWVASLFYLARECNAM